MFVPAQLTRGPFTVPEALEAGLTERQLRGRTWRRLSRGVYVWAELDDCPSLRLAAVSRRLPAGAAFSDHTAAWLHGLDLPSCSPIEVTVPPGCGVSARAGVRVHRATLEPEDVVEHRGFFVTSRLRTILDLARRLQLVEAVVAVDMALHGALVSLRQLRAYVAGRPRLACLAQARQTVELAEPRSESPMESRLRMTIVLAGLPRPEAQVDLSDGQGRFIGRVDLYYPTHRVAIEYDGGTHRDSLVPDNRRQNRLLNAGYQLLRFTAADVYNAPESLVAQVRTSLHR